MLSNRQALTLQLIAAGKLTNPDHGTIHALFAANLINVPHITHAHVYPNGSPICYDSGEQIITRKIIAYTPITITDAGGEYLALATLRHLATLPQAPSKPVLAYRRTRAAYRHLRRSSPRPTFLRALSLALRAAFASLR